MYKRQACAPANNLKIAVVGSGPAGLSFAGDMAKLGSEVTVFEALHAIGGALDYGIPEFRLPTAVVDVEINNLKAMGVEFITNCIIGKTISIDDLKEDGFKGVFVASGAGLPRFMNIRGENYVGVMSSNEYLTRVNLMDAASPDSDTPVFLGKHVAVIGGGNTAMDSVRTAKRLGAKRAMIVYRRSEEEMPARLEEVHHAKEEGIESVSYTHLDVYKRQEQMRNYSDEVLVMTDDGSYGTKGLVTNGVESIVNREKVDLCVTIGPAVMMKFVSLLTKKYEIPTAVSYTHLFTVAQATK